MKILITGFTAFHVGRRDRLKSMFITNNVDPLMENFRTLGHEVVNKPIEPNEDVSMYDRVFVFVIEIGSLNARYSAGALHVLKQRSDAYIVIDDAKSNIKQHQRMYLSKYKHRKIFRAKGYHYRDKIWREQYAEYLIECLEPLTRTWEHTVIVPALKDFDTNEVGIENGKFLRYDSSPWWDEIYTEIKFNYANKKRNWIMVSQYPERNKFLYKIKYNWPIINIGSKKIGVGRIEEREVIRYYANNWGLFFNTWRYPGFIPSGFWTYKFMTCKNFGNIPFGMPEEIGFVGPTWEWCAKHPEVIEILSDKQLVEMHHDGIVKELDKILWNREQLRDFCVGILGV
jgi:hypothetical protein